MPLFNIKIYKTQPKSSPAAFSIDHYAYSTIFFALAKVSLASAINLSITSAQGRMSFKTFRLCPTKTAPWTISPSTAPKRLDPVAKSFNSC